MAFNMLEIKTYLALLAGGAPKKQTAGHGSSINDPGAGGSPAGYGLKETVNQTVSAVSGEIGDCADIDLSNLFRADAHRISPVAAKRT